MKVVWGMPHRCVDNTHAALLDRCLYTIRQIYQDHDILIVDSDSPNKQYLPGLAEKYRAVVAPIINRNYECGAWKIVYEYHPDADFYCLIHDSCWLVRPLDETFDVDVSAYRCVPNDSTRWYGAGEEVRQTVIASLRDTKWDVPEFFWTLVGNIMYCKRHVLAALYDNGFFNVLPLDKHDACSYERRLGVCLCQDGYTKMLEDNQIGCWRHGKPRDHKMAKNWVNRK